MALMSFCLLSLINPSVDKSIFSTNELINFLIYWGIC